MRGKLVVGNWKMNGGLRQNDALLESLRAGWRGVDGKQVAVCVPYPYLAQAQAALSDSTLAWGAQNLSAHAAGAFTGEVSAAMLVDFACRYVIVGHSERRALYGETDAMVAAKTLTALGAGLVPIVCVGETLAEREAGITDRVVLRQLDAVLEAVGDQVAGIVLAYEPVWAIGTGRTATPSQAEAVHGLLRQRLREQTSELANELANERANERAADGIAILYGGSVKADNAKALFSRANIDGGLVGGASLKADEFLSIANA